MEYQELTAVRKYDAFQSHAMDGSFEKESGAHKKEPEHGKEDGGETQDIGLTESRHETQGQRGTLDVR